MGEPFFPDPNFSFFLELSTQQTADCGQQPTFGRLARLLLPNTMFLFRISTPWTLQWNTTVTASSPEQAIVWECVSFISVPSRLEGKLKFRDSYKLSYFDGWTVWKTSTNKWNMHWFYLWRLLWKHRAVSPRISNTNYIFLINYRITDRFTKSAAGQQSKKFLSRIK